MNLITRLEASHNQWQSRLLEMLKPEQRLRRILEREFERFYHAQIQAILENNPEIIETLIGEWITGFEPSWPNVKDFLNTIYFSAYEVNGKTNDESLDEVFGQLIHYHLMAHEYLIKKEANLQLIRVKNEIERVRHELESLDKSKTDFISVAAHELKTPLTLIEGYTSMLREIASSVGVSSQFILLLGGIDSGSNRLREIIDDMIDVSLIDNNLLQLNIQPLWIDQLLGMIEREISLKISERKIKLIIQRFDGDHELFFGDPERLFQALLNIIQNAIKFTPDGGMITVAGRKLPGFLEITVQDTGIGISPEDQMRIFQKFQRIGDTSLHSTGKIKFKGGGPGLGLAITKGIIEAHGGGLWVESPGYDEQKLPGSTFHVLLPIQNNPPDDKIARLFGTLMKRTD